MNWEVNYLELASDAELISWYKKVQAGKDPMKEGVDFEVRRKGKTPAELGGADAWYHRNLGPEYYGFAPGSSEAIEYIKAYKEWDEGPTGGKQWENVNVQERDRSDDWDEGNTEPPNNFAVYINGKKWKVFRGRGYYADDERERTHYYQLQDWARKKSAATGKKWTVHVTGEAPTE